jgi:hypothetical protein
MYIVTAEPISAAYFINPISVCICMNIPPLVARQRLGKNVTSATNAHATLK